MTSEAHKRNPPGSDRWGNKVRLSQISTDELIAITDEGIGAPKLYLVETVAEDAGYGNGVSLTYYCEADELAKWRAARASGQAGALQE